MAHKTLLPNHQPRPMGIRSRTRLPPESQLDTHYAPYSGKAWCVTGRWNAHRILGMEEPEEKRVAEHPPTSAFSTTDKKDSAYIVVPAYTTEKHCTNITGYRNLTVVQANSETWNSSTCTVTNRNTKSSVKTTRSGTPYANDRTENRTSVFENSQPRRIVVWTE